MIFRRYFLFIFSLFLLFLFFLFVCLFLEIKYIYFDTNWTMRAGEWFTKEIIYLLKKSLNLSWRRSLSCRNQSTENWFLYDKNLHQKTSFFVQWQLSFCTDYWQENSTKFIRFFPKHSIACFLQKSCLPPFYLKRSL